MAKTTKPESENPKNKNITLRVTSDLRNRADRLREAHFSSMDKNAFFAYLAEIGIVEEETRFEEEKIKRETRLKKAAIIHEEDEEFDPEGTNEIIRDRSDEEWGKTADNIIKRAREKIKDSSWGKDLTGINSPKAISGKQKYIKVINALRNLSIDPYELQLMDSGKK